MQRAKTSHRCKEVSAISISWLFYNIQPNIQYSSNDNKEKAQFESKIQIYFNQIMRNSLDLHLISILAYYYQLFICTASFELMTLSICGYWKVDY